MSTRSWRPYHAHWRHATDVLLAPWKARGTRRKRLWAAIALALSFDTWRTLVRDHDLTQAQAMEVATRLADDAQLVGQARGGGTA